MLKRTERSLEVSFVLVMLIFSSPLASSGASNIVSQVPHRVLVSPDRQLEGYFGYSVALSNTVMLVDSPGQNVSGNMAAGAAYAFDVKSGKLLLSLLNPYPRTNGFFGSSVAIWRGFDLVIGEGLVYVFNGTTGSLAMTLTSPQTNEDFETLAVSGDILLVGANGNSSGQIAAGNAYAYNLTNGALINSFTSPDPLS
jgi:outer membrane protein assembly factor BamB